MKQQENYCCFVKSHSIQYRKYKCLDIFSNKQEYFAEDMEGNSVILITCCSYLGCYSDVKKQKQFLDPSLTYESTMSIIKE